MRVPAMRKAHACEIQFEDTGSGHSAPGGVANWLSLAAAPTFAVMALLTGLSGGQPDILCSAMHNASPLGGMVPMYVLMAAFHLSPWLRLIAASLRTSEARHQASSGHIEP
jgi:hypothetical protein